MKRLAWTIAFGAVLAAMMRGDERVSAHFTAVSPYTYWRDIVPILETRCARCHTDGSASGLSLMNYQSARGATWLIRQRLIRGHMPPWFAEGPFKSPPPMTSRELDTLMTWAAGGAPEGRLVPAPALETTTWPIGPPDLVLSMPSSFTFTTAQGDQVHEVTLPSAKVAGRVVRAVDLAPGTAALVRSAEIVARHSSVEQVLALWQPGETPITLSGKAGFGIPRGAQLVLRLRYRRLYGAPASDRSQVGIYFAERNAALVQTVEFTNTPPALEHRIQKRSAIVAVRPVSGPSGAWVRVDMIDTHGERKELARLQLQRDWKRRYVFDTPIEVEAGNRIAISVIPSQAALWTTLTSERADSDSAIRVAIEYMN